VSPVSLPRGLYAVLDEGVHLSPVAGVGIFVMF